MLSNVKTEESTKIRKFMASFYTFRFVFMMILVVAAGGVVLKVVRQIRINYIKIFNVEVKHKITHVKLFRISSILFAIWIVCLMLQVLIIKMDQIIFEKAVAGFTMAVICLVIIVCLNPFPCLFRTNLILMWKTFLNIIISPFGQV